MRVWRLVRARRASSAFTGEGARIVAGRWNHKGHPAVYTSQSIALSVLEALVHLDPGQMPAHVVIPADIPEGIGIKSVDPHMLPSGWNNTPAPVVLRDIGTDWLEAGQSAVLSVPSAIVADESNYLLNPLHGDFTEIRIGKASTFELDGRLRAPP